MNSHTGRTAILRKCVVACLGAALFGACDGPPTLKPRPYEIQVEACDTNGDPIADVEVLEANNQKLLTQTDDNGQARLRVDALPGSAFHFRIKPPAGYKLGDQGDQRSEILRPGPPQRMLAQVHEVVLQPLKLNYVLLVDGEIPYSDVLVNNANLGRLNSQGAAALVYSGVPDTPITVRVEPPEGSAAFTAQKSEQPSISDAAQGLASLDPRTTTTFKLTEPMDGRILFFRSTLKLPKAKIKKMHLPPKKRGIVDISALK
jgi:hypothetical protein